MMHSKKVNILVFGIGLTLVLVGLILGTYGPIFFAKLSKEKLQLGPSSYSFSLWNHTPLPLYLDIYLFNWTNSDEFLKNSSTVPYFEEVGPFVFKEVHDRVNIVWNKNNTVTYNQTRKWIFVPEESQNISLQITNLNVIATTIGQLFSKNERHQKILNLIISTFENLFITSPAKNWLFEGIDDKILNYMRILENILDISVPFKKFGWFYGRNMSSTFDGIFTIKTGADNLYNLGIMDKWNHVNVTHYYDNDCAMVNGTSGELFPPLKDDQSDLTVFISDICSSITLNHTGSSIIKGIESYNFVSEESTLDNGQIHSKNKCFCRGECAPYGVRDVSACRMGAPLFFSFPHFYLADESYRTSIDGMMPNKSLHEFMLQLNPEFGIPTNVRAQLQINILLKPLPWLKMFRNVPKLYIPMMWFRQRAEITPKLAFAAKMMHLIPKICIVLFYSLFGLGILVIVTRSVIIYRKRENLDSELLIPPCSDHEEDKVN